MDFFSGVAEILRLWAEGADWNKIQAARGFNTVLTVLCWVVPTTIITLGFGIDSWRELPVARFLGFRPSTPAEDSAWAERARDLDKDGAPDI